MGRPINFKKIGGNTSAAGQQLLLSAWFDGEVGPEDAFVVKQTASRSFMLAAVANPARVGVFKLDTDEVEGETAVLEVEPFGKTNSVGFGFATVSLTTGGATTLADGNYDLTLSFNGGLLMPSQLDPQYFPVIKFRVEDGEFVEIIEIVNAGRFPDDPDGITYTFNDGDLAIQTPPTVTVDSTVELFEQVVEKASKLTQHRVVTSNGNAYKYKVGVAADEDGEADVKTA
jgi:hypothetical protein